jgi:uncharacterized protein YbbC (DUF1343 family)
MYFAPMYIKSIGFILLVLTSIGCQGRTPRTLENSHSTTEMAPSPKVMTGASQFEHWLPAIKNKRVALVVNHTAVVGDQHLVDTLRSLNIDIVKIFGPEHGFRGAVPDGELINHSVDTRTGIPIISLYGKNKKPTPEQMADVDVVVFDIQDVGTRFYTYISTMHYAMEACAENNKPIIVLDRPNPNPFVDGPMNEKPFSSFVAMHPIPVAHGMTVGELAGMINGEKWLSGNKTCDLTIIPLKHWNRAEGYVLPIAPSPNLPNQQAIRLYPSLCLFEGTVISVGRGTDLPFQILGNPKLTTMAYQFTPHDISGVTKNPPHKDVLCYGVDLSKAEIPSQLDLSYLITFYQAYPEKDKFFTPYFNTLAGNTTLKEQIIQGLSEQQIRETWKSGITEFLIKRKPYLLYP